ncbi:MAG TPA: hypothetical protein VFS90_08055, partial [Pyrinomonadaceae bacterium]|nr:hypothetical protein [Pyrinomonadaceae bacterium]
NTNFGIAPMSKAPGNVDTVHQIKVTRNNEAADASFVLSPITTNVPGGLWAADGNSKDVNAPSLIENALIGFEIAPAKPPVLGHTKSIPRGELNYTTHPIPDAYSDDTIHTFKASVPSPGDDPVANNNLWTRIQKEIHTNPTRDQMLADLGFGKADFDIGEPFTVDAAYAPSYGALSS